ncbi:MAG TPA: DUF6460 domain-containing protein [Lichenihabitans sp.]|jgi:hypothetical protein|nr:DUF6460 domain-containing protein [Lichenihabitans sp.]
MSDSALHRFLGGSPLAVAVRLVFVSLIVGALMSWLDIDPVDLLVWLRVSVQHLWATGFEGLRQVGHYVAIGAAVVLPVWLVLRILGGARGRPARAPDGPWRLPGDAEVGRRD